MRAEKQGETNKSGLRRIIMSRLSSFALFRLSLSHKVFMWKVRWWHFWVNLGWSINRFFHCRTGNHNSVHCKESIERLGNKSFKVKFEFLRCRNCDNLFFANAKDKQNYLNLHSGKRNYFKKAVEAIKSDKGR